MQILVLVLSSLVCSRLTLPMSLYFALGCFAPVNFKILGVNCRTRWNWRTVST